PGWILTAAAHSLAAVEAAATADALLISPVFPSNSPSAVAPLGLAAFSALVAASTAPVYALGGVAAQTAPLLGDSGAAGLAGIDAFLPGEN
ncbi:MAG: thiamine monophosphate synthase, partial [Caulobacter sp.]|nr:thiamine monophosphate synthase [Caulobacter sp.]